MEMVICKWEGNQELEVKKRKERVGYEKNN